MSPTTANPWSGHDNNNIPDSRWTRRRSEKQRRLGLVKGLADGVVLPTDKIVAALEALILPGDRVVLEGNNQKQADFLSAPWRKSTLRSCTIYT